MEKNLEYWEKRCKLAENFIDKSPCDPDITNDQMRAFEEWQSFVQLENKENIINSKQLLDYIFVKNSDKKDDVSDTICQLNAYKIKKYLDKKSNSRAPTHAVKTLHMLSARPPLLSKII